LAAARSAPGTRSRSAPAAPRASRSPGCRRRRRTARPACPATGAACPGSGARRSRRGRRSPRAPRPGRPPRRRVQQPPAAERSYIRPPRAALDITDEPPPEHHRDRVLAVLDGQPVPVGRRPDRAAVQVDLAGGEVLQALGPLGRPTVEPVVV